HLLYLSENIYSACRISTAAVSLIFSLSVSANLLAHAQLGAPGPGIVFRFLLAGANRLSRDFSNVGLLSAYAYGKFLRTRTRIRSSVHDLFYNAILKRMERNDAQSSARPEHIAELFHSPPQLSQLVIHFYSYGLESPLGRMRPFSAGFRRNSGFDYFHQFA